MEKEAINNSFMLTLAGLAKGRILDELSCGLQELTLEILRIGGKGKITLIMEVIECLNYGEPAVEIVPTVTLKLPKSKEHGNLFFALDDGKLTRDAPRQEDIFSNKTILIEETTNERAAK